MPDHKVKLNYNIAEKTLTVDPSHVPIHAGDTLSFSSPQGPVSVKLEPSHLFDRDTYSSEDQKPVRVLRAGSYAAHCGVVIEGKTIGWPKEKGWGTGDPAFPRS
jgi:hypothetical protein